MSPTSNVEIQLADTEYLQNIAHRIRYEVFCEQYSWLKGDPELKLEKDEYDQDSEQVVIFQDKEPVATVRLIRDLPKARLPSYWASEAIREQLKDSDYSCMELSRIASKGLSRALFKHIVNGMGFLMGYLNPDAVCGALDPILVKSIERMGFPIKVIGDPIEYHGKRLPVLIKTSEAVSNASEDWLLEYNKGKRLGDWP